jgi:superfamily II RNA helicase
VEDLISKHSVTTAPNLPERLQMLQNKHILSATLKVVQSCFNSFTHQLFCPICYLRRVLNSRALFCRCQGAKKAVSAAGAMVLGDDLKKRRRVLRQLGYVDSDMVVQAKGHVACEISTSDEIVTTELIFSGILKTLTVEQAVALLSCLVWTEKSTVKVKVR